MDSISLKLKWFQNQRSKVFQRKYLAPCNPRACLRQGTATRQLRLRKSPFKGRMGDTLHAHVTVGAKEGQRPLKKQESMGVGAELFLLKHSQSLGFPRGRTVFKACVLSLCKVLQDSLGVGQGRTLGQSH